MTNGNPSRAEYLAALQHRSQVYRTLHDSRIGREFKLVVSTITFFIVCAGARVLGSIPPDSPLLTKTIPLYDVIVVAAFVFVCVMSFVYLKGSADANNLNQGWAEVAENAMENVYLKKDPPDNLRQYYEEIRKEKELRADTHPNRHRWFWQWVVIVAGAMFSSILIWMA